MIEENIQIESSSFKGISIPTSKTNLLMIKGEFGFLGCGYFNIEVAEKVEEAVALVTGVKNFEDMLEADVFSVSRKATDLGVKVGMKGREALPLLNG